MMKKIFYVILAVCVLFGTSYYEHNYTRDDCKVTQVVDGCARIQDQCGFSWDYNDCNLNVGDIVDLKMHDSLTSACIGDDVIKQVVKK